MRSLRAADLTEMRSADSLWRLRTHDRPRAEAGTQSEIAASLGLPVPGFSSPLGFWFAPADAWMSLPPHVIEISRPTRLKAMARVDAGMPKVAEASSSRNVVITDRTRPGASASLKRRMEISIDGGAAHIAVDEDAWPEAGQAGLLAVATCWRLNALDRSFDRLTDIARSALGRMVWPSIPWIHRSGPPSPDLRRDGRSLLLDLPEFEGPLTDPARFVDTHAAVHIFQRLCAKLGLFDWRDRIDERAEVLDGILDTFAAGHDHRQVITLEVLIILLLAADIALSQFFYTWE